MNKLAVVAVLAIIGTVAAIDFIGGTHSGTYGADFIAFHNGTGYEALASISGRGGIVNGIATDQNNCGLFVGGSFHTVTYNGETLAANNSFVFEGDTINTMNGGVDGDVYTVVRGGSAIFFGGSFESAGGMDNVGGIALWNINSDSWMMLGTGVASGGIVRDVVDMGSEYYIGGTFANVNGVIAGTRNYARYSNVDETWYAVGMGVGADTVSNNNVNAVALYSGINFIGGDFTTSSGNTVNGLGAYMGSAWDHPNAEDPGASTVVYTFAEGTQSLFIGGTLTNGDCGLAAWTTADGLIYLPDDTLCNGLWANGDIRKIHVDAGTDTLYIAGDMPDVYVVTYDTTDQTFTLDGTATSELDHPDPLNAVGEVLAIARSTADIDGTQEICQMGSPASLTVPSFAVVAAALAAAIAALVF